MRKHSTLLVVALALVIILPVGPPQARGAPESFAELAAKLLPAVVNISTTAQISGRLQELPQVPPGSPFEDFFREFFERNQQQQQPPRRRARSLGSGFVIDKSGLIVTNNHVIQDAAEVEVILQNEKRLKAEVVGRDPKTDLAVLRVKPETDLPAVAWGNSDTARVGDWVLAIGNPFGLGGTVTAGIVSARGRDINSGPYDDFIQTDASINRGNSGGPLFNMTGEVVGINTAILSPTGGSIGIGFAVPAATARGIVSQLVRYGYTRRGWLGVRIQRVTQEIAESLGLKDTAGALVASVAEGSPAAKGNIKAGDVILRFDGKLVSEMRRLPRIVAETEIGRGVNVQVWRQRKSVDTTVVVGELEEDEARAVAQRQAEDQRGSNKLSVETLGLTVASIDSATRKKFQLKPNSKGVVVTDVDPKGVAAEKGLAPGDLIVEVSQDEVNDPGDVVAKIETAKKEGRKSVLMLLEGKSGLRFVALRVSGAAARK